ncbi:PE family protein [Mycobacterium haemophilum]|uniref:PE family protein n=2 Tax=Mycobacterium haemophilum TaxID=29311 RepID=UPI0009E1AEA6
MGVLMTSPEKLDLVESVAGSSSAASPEEGGSLAKAADPEELRLNPLDLTQACRGMAGIADRISTTNLRSSAMTEIRPPGGDSVSARLARSFNIRGQLYQEHTDRGANIAKLFSQRLVAGASACIETDCHNGRQMLSLM